MPIQTENLRQRFYNIFTSPEVSARDKGLLFDEETKQILDVVQNPVMGANTIDTELKRHAVMHMGIRAFRKILAPVRIFSTTFRDVALQGTNKVEVPYYPLQTAASTDFNGTYAFGNTTTQKREVEVNKRKYQGISFTSEEFRRQPYLNAVALAEQNSQKLAEDVFADILSLVTVANYGAAEFVGAASSFDGDDVTDLRTVANTRQWPKGGRGLLVDSDYDGALLKDSSIKAADASGSDAAHREGQVGRVRGFDYYESPNIPDNSENLVGMAVYSSAIILALSPIRPTEEVMNRLTRYDIVTDPETGISFEYRRWGNADTDQSREVIECNYGFEVGEAEALMRMASAE